MTKPERDAFIASLQGWRKTLAQQVADYLDDPHHRGVDFTRRGWKDCERAVQSPYGAFNPACLCHEDYLIQVMAQMLPAATDHDYRSGA